MRTILSIIVLTLAASTAAAQMTFTNIESYCTAMSEVSTPTLLARTQKISKQKAIDLMQGMTDPQAIRMAKEVVEFAYARPQTLTIEQMRAELKRLCIDRKIFTQ